MPEGVVVVKAIASFRGQDGEGTKGYVKPGDILRLAAHRVADLRAHRLVEANDYVEPPPAPVVKQKAK